MAALTYCAGRSMPRSRLLAAREESVTRSGRVRADGVPESVKRGDMRWGRRRTAAALLAAAAVLAACCLLTARHRPAPGGGGAVLRWDLPPEDVRRYLKEAEADNAVRLRTIRDTCRRHNLGLHRHSAQPPTFKHPPTPQYAVFYIDRTHKLSWCPVYKAGSTTFLYNLLRLAGFPDSYLRAGTRQLSDLARDVYPELEAPDAEQALHSTLKLLVVRHPFERLLAAYRDKLENSSTGREHGTLHYYRRYGRRVVSRYRKGGNATRTWDLLRADQYLWPAGGPRAAGVEPTFLEFVRYLTDTDVVLHSDDHWIPYYLYCTPCLVDYDIVAKVETLLRDQVYFIHSAHLQAHIQPRWEHRSGGGDVARRYFSQLTRSLVEKLHDKYRLDFELFGYSANEYLDLAAAD
ncbi:carbohydrate sulfotransferase 13-like [Bacillus rossius redtenbacheri]|uniref:carbohydrate sulfotransferase 13-like n=1 Tax=Bacillus rossius redtenbacheri TaxID=93214 RepID=UPI002FDEF3FF